jgi:hypothetical protein
VLALLPPDTRRRLLRHESASGELYHILGLEPASPAQLLSQHLLPRMGELGAPGAASLLGFVSDNWASMKVRGCVGQPGTRVAGCWASIQQPAKRLAGQQDCARASP